MLQGVYMLLKQLEEGRAEIEIGYHRGVSDQGNPTAWALVEKYFMPIDADWRGIGVIPDTGLGLRPEYDAYNAVVKLPGHAAASPRRSRAASAARSCAASSLPYECKLFAQGLHARAPDRTVHGLLGRQLRGLLPLHRLREGLSPCAQTGFSSPTARAAR